MANNLRKGSKVYVNAGHGNVAGVVVKKYSARKGELNVPNKKRTVVEVKASGQTFIKSPSQLKRRK
jgi:hypothetical protein